MNDDAVVDREARAYQAVRDADDFTRLKRRFKNFVLPWTITFMAWYLLYLVCNNWARGFMSTKVIGNVNVALLFGLLQFVSTFGIAWLYARHANRKFDPIAEDLERRYNDAIRPEVAK